MKQVEAFRTEYIPGLDGIRALAIGLVLFGHSVGYGEFAGLHPIGKGAGNAGVIIFFVLSGYLITSILLTEEERHGIISLRLFYKRRAIRLFPALWFYLSLIWIIWAAGGLRGNSFYIFISSLLYIRNIFGRGHETAHLWSLSIEEQFYLAWPIVLTCLPKRNRIRLLVALIGVISVTIWRIYANHMGFATEGILYMRSDFRFDAPLAGCALALIQRVKPSVTRWMNCEGWRSATLAIAGALGLATWLGLRMFDRAYPGTNDTNLVVLGMILIISQIGVQSRGRRLLAWWPLVLVGRLSYGIYLWQQLFLGPPMTGFLRLRTFPIGLIATLAVAVASYLCIERPLLLRLGSPARCWHGFPRILPWRRGLERVRFANNGVDT
jgi:peptidoglycan/LPS O-acetylase OafA/YrhL